MTSAAPAQFACHGCHRRWLYSPSKELHKAIISLGLHNLIIRDCHLGFHGLNKQDQHNWLELGLLCLIRFRVHFQVWPPKLGSTAFRSLAWVSVGYIFPFLVYKYPYNGKLIYGAWSVNREFYTVARRYEFCFRVANQALVRKILFLPRENRIHILKPPCNVLFIL